MQHLTEEQLVLHHYHDGDAVAAVEQHLAECAECRAQADTLRRVLSLVEALPVPERGAGYGEEVWTRLRWKLGDGRRRFRRVNVALAAAAALAIAFVGGIVWHQRTAPAAPGAIVAGGARPAATPAAAQPATQDRILLVVVSDHLDSSERMLMEVANADAKRPLDTSSRSRRAEDLVSLNRMYRQSAAQRGETRIAALLSDIEPVLQELAHAGATLSPDQVAALQKRIDSKGLLFKVRVVSAQAGGREVPAPPKGTSSL